MLLSLEKISDFWKIPIYKNTKDNPLGKWDAIKQKENVDLDKYNYGVLTGKKNDIIGVDLDTAKWSKDHIFYTFFDIDELLNSTYSVKTRSGGYHLYYYYDEEIYQTQDDKYHIDIRSDGGYLVGAGSSVDGKEYKVLNNSAIIEIPAKLKEFLIKYITPPKKTKSVKVKKDNNDHINTTMLNNVLTKKQLNNVLKKLDDKWWSGYGNFLKYTSFCKTLDIKKLWDKYNKKHDNYNFENNENIWNECKTGDGFIIDILNDYNKNILSYWFYRPTLQNKIKPNKTIEKKKLGYEFFNNKNNYVVKSDTGTGKSTSFYTYIKKNNLKFISIGSRISLCQEQYDKLSENGINCKLYSNDGYLYKGDNVIITIDSIMKLLNFDFSDYVIFLDEFNSLVEYLITASTLNNKRTLVYRVFFKILNECKQFIATDADITDNSLLLLNYVDKKYKFIENTYKHNKGVKVFELYNLTDFINDIMTQDSYLICCDSKTNAEMLYNLLNDKDIKLIVSGTDEKVKFDDNKKIIYSPKIIYGIDSSLHRNVYCFYKEHTISPRAMVQQVARCRNIKELKFMFLKKRLTYNDYTINDVNQMILNSDKYATNEFKLLCSKKENEQYMNLLTRFEYDRLCYETNKFCHFIKILKERGFEIQTGEQETDKQNLNTLIKDMKKAKDDNFDVNSEIVKKVNKYLKVPKDKIIEYKEYFTDANLFTQHLNLCDMMNKEKDEIKIKLQDSNDFNTKKTSTREMKLLYTKKLLRLLNCDMYNVFDSDTYDLTEDQRKELFDEFEVVFRNRNTRTFNTDKNIKYYLSVIYKQLFSKNILDSSRKGANKTKKYKIINDFIDRTNDLLKYRQFDNQFDNEFDENDDNTILDKRLF